MKIISLERACVSSIKVRLKVHGHRIALLNSNYKQRLISLESVCVSYRIMSYI